MVSKKKIATAAAATFGVAMASVYIVPELQADIEELTYDGGAASAMNPFFPGAQPIPGLIFIDQIDTDAAAFPQYNDQFGGGTGRTNAFYTTLGPGPMSCDIVIPGDTIDPATFVGRMMTSTSGAVVPGNIGIYSEFDGTGSAFIAVRPRTAPDNLYWFKIEFTQGGPIVYSDGEYGNSGETLTVGGTVGCTNPVGDVNGDGVVTLLDVAPFVAAVQAQDFVCEADINQDGSVDLLDVQPFVTLVQGG